MDIRPRPSACRRLVRVRAAFCSRLCVAIGDRPRLRAWEEAFRAERSEAAGPCSLRSLPQRKGCRPSTLLTSLLDEKRYPANGIVALYHERWELELGYDEIKTHMLDRQEAIRSRTPGGVRQELWGIAIAYNLVRLEMERAADEAGVEPNRISFVNAMALIRNAWLAWSTLPLAPGRIPEGLLYLRRCLKLLILPPRRPERAYPRAVKVKMSAYDRKAPKGKGRK
jgi:hypothetical protein